jgi:hypothetical protein
MRSKMIGILTAAFCMAQASVAMADAVVAYLTAHGVNASSLHAVGVGELGAPGDATNRSVVFLVLSE